MKVTLPALPFDVPPKPKDVTAAAPTRALKEKSVDPELVDDEAELPVPDVTEGINVRWGPRRDWGKV